MSAVGTARFNGTNLSRINLNGTKIWQALPSSTLVAGYHSIRGDKIFGDWDMWGYHPNYSGGIGSFSPNPLNGYNFWSILEERPNNGATRTLGIFVWGSHAKNAFEFFEVNGRRFYTSQTGGGANSHTGGFSLNGELGTDGYSVGAVSGGTHTRWEWGYPASQPVLSNGGSYTVKVG